MPAMECLGPQCAAMLLEWLRERSGEAEKSLLPRNTAEMPRQGLLWKTAPYSEEAPVIASPAELAGAVEHLHYAVFRRYENQLTRAERTRLDNTIENTLFKIDRYLERTDPDERLRSAPEIAGLRETIRAGREKTERLRTQAPRRAQARAIDHALPRDLRGVRRRAFRSPGLHRGADRRYRRRGGRSAAPPQGSAGDCSVQVPQAGRGWLTGAPEVPGNDPPHPEPQGVFCHDEHLLPCGREVRRRSSDRADRRPEARRAGPGSTGAGRRREPQPAWF